MSCCCSCVGSGFDMVGDIKKETKRKSEKEFELGLAINEMVRVICCRWNNY